MKWGKTWRRAIGNPCPRQKRPGSGSVGHDVAWAVWFVLLFWGFAVSGVAESEEVPESIPTPTEWLGFDPQGEGAVVDSAALYGYCRTLSKRAAALSLWIYGLSTDGHPLFVIDTRAPTEDDGVSSSPAIPPETILITCGIHSSEVGSTLSALPFLHSLARGTEAAERWRRRFRLLVVPCINPDGNEEVSAWLESGDARTYGAVPFLYHRFTGHDLNRDWLLGTQPEVRDLVTQIHNKAHPWVTIDWHQMSSRGPRLFLPPFAAPFDPAVRSDLWKALDTLGEAMRTRLEAEGMEGIVTRWRYDAWSPSRAYPFYHGGLRVLLEVASARYNRAVLVPEGQLRVAPSLENMNPTTPWHRKPWRGGSWTLRHVRRTFVRATEAALDELSKDAYRQAYSRQRSRVERSTYELNGGEADPGVVAELLAALSFGGVDIERLDVARWGLRDPSWGAGWCRTLLECAAYPNPEEAVGGDAVSPRVSPYDATGHSLARLAGVSVQEQPTRTESGGNPVPRPLQPSRFESPGRLVRDANGGGGWLLRPTSLQFFRQLGDLAEAGALEARCVSGGALSGTRAVDGKVRMQPGDFVLGAAFSTWVERLVRLGCDAFELEGAWRDRGSTVADMQPFQYPRITLFAGRRASHDEGWLRWLLEDFRFRFATERFEAVAERDLAEWDLGEWGPSAAVGVGQTGREVLLIPEGVSDRARQSRLHALRARVRRGARVIAFGNSALRLDGQLDLSGANVRVLPLRLSGVIVPTVATVPAKNDQSPGGATRAHRTARACLWGYGPSTPEVFCQRGPLWRWEDASSFTEVSTDPGPRAAPLRMASAAPCGLVAPGEAANLSDSLPILVVTDGAGEWILCGIRPHFRAWTMGSFRLLFNMILAP